MRVRQASVLAVGCGLPGLLGVSAVALTLPKDKPKWLPDKLIRSKMQTDGIFTVGQQETITVTKMLRKVKVSVSVEPGGQDCNSDELTAICFPLEPRPAPGTRFRTNGHGQATLTFVMPATYRQFRIREFTMPMVNFRNGQPVEIFAFATHRRGRGGNSKLVWSGASASGIVEVPPAP